MDDFLLYSGLIVAAIAAVVGLQHWGTRSKVRVPAEFDVDPALAEAIDQSFADNCRRATY